MTLGIGIIGAGRMGEMHMESLLKIKDVNVKAVADIDKNSITRFTQKYSVDSYEDYRLLIERKDIHAVIVCLPHTLHHDCVMIAANSGKHILCEKPIETSHEKMDSMLEACRINKVLFMPGHTHRFLPANVKVKELIEVGQIGQPIMMHDKILLMGFEPGYPRWMGMQSLGGGGIFMNNGVHSIDRMRYWLKSEITKVFARCDRFVHDIDTEDNGMIFLTLSNNTFATTELSWSTPKPAGTCLAEIIGTEGIIEFITWKSPIRLMNRKDNQWQEIPVPEGNGFLDEIEEFISAIREDRPASVTPEDGRAAVSVILAAYESSQTGEAVKPK